MKTFLTLMLVSSAVNAVTLDDLVGLYEGVETYSGKDCRFRILSLGEHVYVSLSEEQLFLDKTLRYVYKKDLVEERLEKADERGYALLRHDYGTPSREAFTRFELGFAAGKLIKVDSLKYKNLNYTTRSKSIYCGKLEKIQK